MVVDWSAIFLGFALGVPVSALFFAGLAWGMVRALRSERPEGLLLLSVTLRMAMLLGVGFLLAASSATAWPIAGYGAAFLLVRLVAVVWARAGKPAGLNRQETV